MAKYINRYGIVHDLNPGSLVDARRIKEGEFTPYTSLEKKEEVKKDANIKAELTEKYLAKFGKKPFAGWDEDKLREKLAEPVGE